VAKESRSRLRLLTTPTTGPQKSKNGGSKTGAPGSPKRTWAEKDARSPYDRFCYVDQKIAYETGKAFETYRFRPRYALANLGHPSVSIRSCGQDSESSDAGNTLITINEGYSFHVEGLWKKVYQVDCLHGIIKS
jgi:hypothetical protein